jgi:16S rRNA processing protein RimM
MAIPATIEPLHAPADEPREGYTAVGRVSRPHGLRGEVRVAAFAAGAPNIKPGRQLLLGGVAVRVAAARPSGDAWIVAIDEIRDRQGAERFRGQLFEAPDGEIVRDAEDSYFLHELIGLRVVTTEGEELGVVTEVLQPGANDVYVVRGPRGEILLPAIGDVIKSIDLPVGVMNITPFAGLLDGSA